MSAKSEKISPKRSMLRFVIIYVVLMGIFFLIMGFKPIREYFVVDTLYSNFIVIVTHHILSVLNIQSSYHGTVISFPGISLNVLFGCNGLEAVMIYSIAILAFPAPWKTKLAGIAAGLLIIQVINIVRIVGLAYAAANHMEIFRIMHIYVAQGIMIAIALGIFFVYLHYATKLSRLVN